MSDRPDGLLSIQDFIRWGASRFNEAGLCFGHGADNSLDEAAELVLSALHLPPDFPGTYRDCRLTELERSAVASLIADRISSRKPAAYLTRRARFAGIDFFITEDVLVPRSPLGELVECGFSPWLAMGQASQILDLCAGSGCIGIAAALHLPEAAVDLAELSPKALAVARQNLDRHQLHDRVRVIESDLFSGLTGCCYDLIVSNPPYVAAEELAALPPEYGAEPRVGLAGGADGLDLVMPILEQAAGYLSAEGILIVEVGSSAEELLRQCPEVPFTWLELERGGDGVFLLTRAQLEAFRPSFVRARRGT
jgi:ribosomal protein L3 glutamine methyltransferase